jgi:predicted metal-binding membrane protein
MHWRWIRLSLISGPLPWLIMLAGTGFVIGGAFFGWMSLTALCGVSAWPDLRDPTLLLGPQWSLRDVALGWFVMLLAMMPPLLAQPLLHVWRSSHVRRRPPAVLIFACGYTSIWLGAGLLLVPAAILARLSLGSGAPVAALCLALLWSCSPIAQSARNACHRMRRITVFGPSADRDCLRFGIFVGAACLSACWPWMVLASVVDEWHVLIMAIVALILFVERIVPPAPLAWRMPPVLTFAASMMSRQNVLGRP